ncbi:hypothetical protein [Arthrobacter sp. Bi83]|uniref:hypothetical protein n=1 Tax=Arthrobacter sp. Bi83 TaxID=2822353 RepID=UPI001E30433B|nr:hypothetical protein [Arthrobacter sp. Bi83]
MNSPGSRAAPASLINRHPVTAFLVVAITLSWAAQIGSILLIGNILPGILAELLILVGLLHASFNASASAQLDVFDGEWQQIAAVAVLLGVPAALRGFRGKRPAQGPRERTLRPPPEAARKPPEEAGRGSPPAS